MSFRSLAGVWRRSGADPSRAAVITLNSDPDVVATSYGLSLKDPVRSPSLRAGETRADDGRNAAHDGEDQDADSLDSLQSHWLL